MPIKLHLDKMDKKLDKVLENETEESLTDWYKRKHCKHENLIEKLNCLICEECRTIIKSNIHVNNITTNS